MKGLATKVPRMAASLFPLKRKAVGREKSMANPKVGVIPQNTPMANPRAIFFGESLVLSIFLMKFLVFCNQDLFVDATFLFILLDSSFCHYQLAEGKRGDLRRVSNRIYPII